MPYIIILPFLLFSVPFPCLFHTLCPGQHPQRMSQTLHPFCRSPRATTYGEQHTFGFHVSGDITILVPNKTRDQASVSLKSQPGFPVVSANRQHHELRAPGWSTGAHLPHLGHLCPRKSTNLPPIFTSVTWRGSILTFQAVVREGYKVLWFCALGSHKVSLIN